MNNCFLHLLVLHMVNGIAWWRCGTCVSVATEDFSGWTSDMASFNSTSIIRPRSEVRLFFLCDIGQSDRAMYGVGGPWVYMGYTAITYMFHSTVKHKSIHPYQGSANDFRHQEIDGRGESFEGAKWLESKFRNRQPIGWDLEWPPDRCLGVNMCGPMVAVLEQEQCLGTHVYYIVYMLYMHIILYIYICMHVMRTFGKSGDSECTWRLVHYILPGGLDLLSRWTDQQSAASRTKDSNNPIALMQFADHETVLLIRTHRTEA